MLALRVIAKPVEREAAAMKFEPHAPRAAFGRDPSDA